MQSELSAELSVMKSGQLHEEFIALPVDERAKFDLKESKDYERYKREYSALHSRPGDGYQYYVKSRFLDNGFHGDHEKQSALFNQCATEWHEM